MSTVYEYQVGSITWKYTLDVNNNATIGTGTTVHANATTAGKTLSGAINIPATVGVQNYPVKTIGLFAFFQCTSITSVAIPNSVTTIDGQSFYSNNLSSLTIPNSVTSIGTQAFMSNPNLTTVKIGNSVTTIGAEAFRICSSLTSINIPTSVTTFGTAGSGVFEQTNANLVITMNPQTINNTSYNSPTTTDIPFFGNPSVTFVRPPAQPTITIESTTVASGSITTNGTISLTFRLSVATTDFAVQDITVTNGALSDFTGGGTIYTATFTTTSPGACTIDVAVGAFTDAYGQNNIAAAQYAWTFARTVSFDTNTITITNSIAANATDPVLFVLPSGQEMSSLNVTAFTGTGSISYTLSTTGKPNITGTFNAIGANLLSGNRLFASTNTNYTLTLTAGAALSYTIVGTKNIDYGNVTPTTLSFINNTLTIENSIDANDTDAMTFILSADYEMSSLNVTGFSGSGSISYTLSRTGKPNITGTFNAIGTNLLAGNPLIAAADTTYTLTFSSTTTNAYKIIGTSAVFNFATTNYSIDQLLDIGFTLQRLIDGGVWNSDPSANRFNRTYLNNFIDLSGSLLIRNDGALIGGGDVSFNNITVAGSTTFAGDMTLKSKLFIGNDISVNGNLYVGGDLSVNGIFSGDFANNVIPTSAIINYPSSGSNVEITGNVRVTGDASFNGTNVELSTNTILQVNGQVAFTDGTSFSTYDNNILSGTVAQGNVIFKDSTFAAVTCTGPVTAGSQNPPSDYRLKTNVTNLDGSYTIDNLEPIQYNNILSNKHEFGLIAHELQAVYPELVKGEKDGAEYQRVNYNGLIGVLVKEVQEIKRRIEDLYTPINQ
jgi:hypothetical protein